MNDPIYDVAHSVASNLKAASVPATVEYGAVRFEPVPGWPRLKFERDRGAGDTWTDAKTTSLERFRDANGQVNSTGRRPFGSVLIGVLVTASAASKKRGATENDHIAATWELLNELQCSLRIVCAGFNYDLSDCRGSFLTIEDGAPHEIGARYALRFTITTGVERETVEIADTPINVYPTVRVFVADVEQIVTQPETP